ncbi:MAG: hypothetical protein AAFR14_02470, partial [Bacteroidota bacterium]
VETNLSELTIDQISGNIRWESDSEFVEACREIWGSYVIRIIVDDEAFRRFIRIIRTGEKYKTKSE